MASSGLPTGYVLQTQETEGEMARLDAMHNGIAKFLDNKLSHVDAELGQPRKIVDIGAGSGAWAIQAAKQFPDADVLAVDMTPLPARPLPSNLTFQQHNALEPFPLEAGSFDIVHARLVLCHLPEAHSVLSRIIDLVKPGGWLLIDDLDWSGDFKGLDKAPGVKFGLSLLVKFMEAAAGDPHYAKTLKPYLEAATDRLSEVHVREVDISINPIPKDPAMAGLSQVIKKSLVSSVSAAPVNDAVGFTKEAKDSFLEEMSREGLDWKYSSQFYFTWSKKRV
ncbi:S-adenosyl-L-methionine-dependent methyltransferase [Mycena crocata]|nr:S-adenosyl-L-methionine-dependent methyltransferase [Mycena crocata]